MGEIYKNGIKKLAEIVKQKDATVILIGNSAAHLKDELASEDCRPPIVSIPSRRDISYYPYDVKAVTKEIKGPVIIAEDYSDTGTKITELHKGNLSPNVEIITVVASRNLGYPRHRALEIDSEEAFSLHLARHTPPTDRTR